MLKNLQVITLMCVFAFALLSGCKDPSNEIKKELGPVTPVISAHPQGAVYFVDDQAAALTVTASRSDKGTLSYQWYSNTTDSKTGGTVINGETKTSYTPPTDVPGIVYYYVVVSNKLNSKTVNATSNTAQIEVKINPNENIDLSISNIEAGVDIGSITEGEEADPFEVTITNNSDKPTGDLTIKLDGDDADKFTIEPDTFTLDSIDPGDSGSFQIIPDPELEEGTYTATVMIESEDGIKIEFEITFTVLAELAIEWPLGITANLWMGHVKNTESVKRKLSDILLTSYTNDNTGSFAWTNPETELDELGLNSYNMIFTPDDIRYNPVNNDVEIRVQLGVEMVKVDGGSYMFGKNGTTGGEATPTTVGTFNIGKFQVTQEQWIAVMGNNFSNFHGGAGREPSVGEIQGKRPVERVTWFDAIEFCNKLSVLEGLTPAYNLTVTTRHANGYITAATVTLADGNGYRLPEERQWEFAAKGGIKTVGNSGAVGGLPVYTETSSDTYLIYSGSNNPDVVAWYSGKAGVTSRTHEVGLLAPNELGIFDMSGNVWEWCWDIFSGSTRVLRGGCWDYSAGITRSVSRDGSVPDGGYGVIGFRLVRP